MHDTNAHDEQEVPLDSTEKADGSQKAEQPEALPAGEVSADLAALPPQADSINRRLVHERLFRLLRQRGLPRRPRSKKWLALQVVLVLVLLSSCGVGSVALF